MNVTIERRGFWAEITFPPGTVLLPSPADKPQVVQVKLTALGTLFYVLKCFDFTKLKIVSVTAEEEAVQP